MEQKTIEELQQENAQLKNALAAAETKASENLELAIIADKKASETQAEIEEVKKQLAAACQANEDLEDEVEALKAKLPEDEKKKEQHSFEFAGEKYDLLVHAAHIPGINDGKPLTALEIVNSSEAQEKLVKSNSGLIRKHA